ncbi:hypothetical protein [Marinihelvus fidelis]|uniref:hypothetical protein n=1 Tax=Marinihelvus fidelis TaxID=2613842 RepID=UPI001784E49A|nr:hypothetical protein [Marinihelvus fidelis]
MKYLLAIFMLLYALQPVPLQACDMDMDKAQDNTHHSTMLDSDSPDCCDSEDSMSGDCMDAATCGSCPIGLTLFATKPVRLILTSSRHLEVLESSRLTAIHSHPPFRPPIA